MKNSFLTFAVTSFLLFIATISIGCEKKEAYLIIPNQSVGEITKTTTRQDLDVLFGQENIIDEDVHVAEGNYEKGTVIFPKIPDKKLEILWIDPETKKQPATIKISAPEGTKNVSVWHTESKISLGTKLKTLENLNGNPFKLWGFGWDYGGGVSDWQNGKLDTEGGLSLTLNPDHKSSYTLVDKVLGDSEFLSSDKTMQKLNPEVVEMVIYLNRPNE